MDNKDESSASSSASSCEIDSSSSQPHVPCISHKRKAGRRKFRETRHPVYRGVRQRNGNKWVCEVREPKKKSRIWLGTYPTPEMAARAHDVAALALRGELAALNFPDSAWLLPRAKSSSAGDIQMAALEAAEVFRPAPSSPSSSCIASSRKVIEPINLQCFKNQKKDNQEHSITNLTCVNNSWEKAPETSTTSLFLDEEALFNMPGFIDSMAEGLLLTPPSMQRGFKWDDTTCDHMDMTLWDCREDVGN